eukprot:4343914-Prymnesium_polylepis.1
MVKARPSTGLDPCVTLRCGARDIPKSPRECDDRMTLTRGVMSGTNWLCGEAFTTLHHDCEKSPSRSA